MALCGTRCGAVWHTVAQSSGTRGVDQRRPRATKAWSCDYAGLTICCITALLGASTVRSNHNVGLHHDRARFAHLSRDRVRRHLTDALSALLLLERHDAEQRRPGESATRGATVHEGGVHGDVAPATVDFFSFLFDL